MSYDILLGEAHALGLSDGVPVKETTARDLVAKAAKAPTPIPDKLKERAAKVKTPEEASTVVAEYRSLRAGDAIDYTELLSAAQAAERAAKAKHYKELVSALWAELQATWSRLVTGVEGFELVDLGEESVLRGDKARNIVGLREDFERLPRLVKAVLNYARPAIVSLPDSMRGFSEAWVHTALFTSIPGDEPDAYRAAWYTNVDWASLKGIKKAVAYAEEHGFELVVRSPEAVQAALDGWSTLKEWFWVDQRGGLNKLERPGTRIGHRVPQSKIEQAILRQELGN
ncbi:hypothetical protein [Amycolatopsis rubida]|uniref:Uncharacterized protein n=1 Tax=Amycolatopsis rubida TaxID=112413 RepID=A0A1I5MGG6_9PSEU|nr:hypothetical protein [Amycolatopsis rubida]SFP08685.1 hypothetical protein SAMN05421854_10440 [Amycolatopsis rubida]